MKWHAGAAASGFARFAASQPALLSSRFVGPVGFGERSGPMKGSIVPRQGPHHQARRSQVRIEIHRLGIGSWKKTHQFCFDKVPTRGSIVRRMHGFVARPGKKWPNCRASCTQSGDFCGRLPQRRLYLAPRQYKKPSVVPITTRPLAMAGDATMLWPRGIFCSSAPFSRSAT
jgi:hypothetical protein